MCGICGVYRDPAADPAILQATVARMTASLIHRGPDDDGVWGDRDGRIALGNRRLSIIDLSPAGHQPMVDASGQVALTYNGEIYNFLELRRELAASGYAFRGHSDTEVILALYLREGLAVCRHLRGMFALAIWDGRSRQLLLARDRLGIKPLYYGFRSGCCVFASEIRAIRLSGLVPVAPSPAGLAAFLRLGSVPAPLTAFEGIREVPPATVLILGPKGESISTHRYWEIPVPHVEDEDAAAVAEGLRERLLDAVSRHLVSDVPLGVFLSGGVDSGAIVAMMREAGHDRIRTFSITFPEMEFDEGADAARVANRYGAEHTASEVRGEQVAADLDGIIEAMDQPTVDGLNTYYVSRATRRSGTIVALSGLGGDELFGGYPSFRQTPRLFAWQRVAARFGPARPVLAAALGAASSSRGAKLKEGLMEAATLQTAYLAVRGLLSRAEVNDLLVPGSLRDASLELDTAAALSALAPALPDNPVAATGILELRGYMHNQLLRDADVMSMRHSLEVRVPFLDHPLVEFAASLPACLRSNGHPPKWLLLQAIGDRLQPETGRIKRGFTFPLGSWLRGALRPRVEQTLRDGGHMFRPQALAGLRARVEAGRAHWSRLWALVVLILWLRSTGLRERV